jgi:two-component system, OmpR family, response regulator
MGRKIMIVDDDLEFLEELKETLGLSGYDVVHENSSVAAVMTANRVKPDLVLLDLKMPDKSGFQLADELRHASELGNIPIIAMTGFLKDEYIPLISICGIRKCLKKPFNPLDVIAHIEEALLDNGGNDGRV